MDSAGGTAGRCRGDRGAVAPEYSLLLAFIALLCIGLVAAFGARNVEVFDKADDGFNRTPTPTTCCEVPVSTPGSPGATVPTSTTLPPCPPNQPPAGPNCTTTTTGP